MQHTHDHIISHVIVRCHVFMCSCSAQVHTCIHLRSRMVKVVSLLVTKLTYDIVGSHEIANVSSGSMILSEAVDTAIQACVVPMAIVYVLLAGVMVRSAPIGVQKHNVYVHVWALTDIQTLILCTRTTLVSM